MACLFAIGQRRTVQTYLAKAFYPQPNTGIDPRLVASSPADRILKILVGRAKGFQCFDDLSLFGF